MRSKRALRILAEWNQRRGMVGQDHRALRVGDVEEVRGRAENNPRIFVTVESERM